MSETYTLEAAQQHALRIPLNGQRRPMNGDAVYDREFFPDLLYRAEQILTDADNGVNGLNNRSFEAHLAYGVMQKIERLTVATVDDGEGAAYSRELEARSQGFNNAGREQTGLEPPAPYKRIARIADVLIDASQHSVAIADARLQAAMPSRNLEESR